MALSASNVERALACAASVYLPQADRDTKYAERGDTIDHFVRDVLGGTPIAQAIALVKDAAVRDTCSRIDFDKLVGDLRNVRTQVAYVIDLRTRTAREIGRNIGRKYGELSEFEIPGTLDIEGETESGTPVIDDVKAGYVPVTPVEENGQLRTYAAAKALVTGASEVEARVGYIRVNGRVHLDTHTFTTFDTDSFLDEVEEGIARIDRERRVYLAGGSVDVHPGAWCRYCPAMHVCPAQTQLARAMIPTLEQIRARIAELSLVECGAAWRTAEQAKNILDMVWEALELRAKSEHLPYEPGKVVRASRFERDSFSTADALTLLRQLGATEDQISALYKTIIVESVRVTKDPNAPKAPRKPRAKKERAA